MTEYSKFNFVYRMQKWMDSVPGQTFLNYAYSWGASIVILGTLFKLTHLPGANIMLFLGMGTEVLVFFISAFDRPFDKTADGRELPTHLTEQDLAMEYEYDDEGNVIGQHPIAPAAPAVQPAAAAGSTIIIGGGSGTAAKPEAAATPQPAAAQPAAAAQSSATASQPQSKYVDALGELTDMLSKVAQQSERLTRDSEEMENLNRTLTGITKIYEMQLKAASQQVGTIDQINEQTRRMAQQIEQLNAIYARMIEAMTVNMRAANPNL